MRVTIKDDTLRRNAVIMVTPEIRANFARAGRPLANSVRFLPAIDRKGRKVQETVTVVRVLEGTHLDHALRRARRFMRSRRFRTRGNGVPRHLALFMAAFHKVDPEGFKEAVHHVA